MITQDIVRKLWDEAGNGNVAVWEDGTMTVVPPDYSGDAAGREAPGRPQADPPGERVRAPGLRAQRRRAALDDRGGRARSRRRVLEGVGPGGTPFPRDAKGLPGRSSCDGFTVCRGTPGYQDQRTGQSGSNRPRRHAWRS